MKMIKREEEENRELLEDNIREEVTHQEGEESSSYKCTKEDDSSSFTSEERPSSKKRIKVEAVAVGNDKEGPKDEGDANNDNLPALGDLVSQTTTTTNNNNNWNAGFSFAFGLPSLGTNANNNMQQLPMLGMMGFPGTSPNNSWMGNANDFYGYGPATSIHNNNQHYHHHRNASTPEVPPLNGIKMENGHVGDGSGGGGQQQQQQQQRISGMTPLVFQQHRVVPTGGSHAATHQQLLQVVSTDSQTDDYLKTAGSSNHPPPHVPPLPSSSATMQQHSNIAMIPRMGKMPAQQQSKKWVRWSDYEDQFLRRAVALHGENNFKFIAENIFNNTRNESQCKNRWKKTLQPGLVKGKWSKEEDERILAFGATGSDKWSDLHLPGRITEHIKDRWINVLDPTLKKGVWSEAEMKILRDSQKELGNKWCEIAKRIPGRNEASVKNRWYNQKTSDKRAEKKRQRAEQAKRQSLEQQVVVAERSIHHLEHEQQQHEHEQQVNLEEHSALYYPKNLKSEQYNI